MTLLQILVLIPIAVLIGSLTSRIWRVAFIMGSSVLAVYWLQPAMPIRNLDFWLPTAAIGLTILVWTISIKTKSTAAGRSNDLVSALIVIGLILAIAAGRYFEPLCCLTASRPPEINSILLAIGTSAVSIAVVRRASSLGWLVPVAILVLIGLFFLLKSPTLSLWTSHILRSISGQETSLASAVDIRWLGYSYLAFRLLHVLRDGQQGKLKPTSLSEFVSYALFWPAYTAGPIDRSQHFLAELSTDEADGTTGRLRLQPEHLATGGSRVIWGVFKKFVLADSLALIAINSQNAGQTTSSGWLWVLLYAYSLRIYFDFSGYTDIALGLGNLMGISLPENFERPYLKTSLTAFWNSWHITLAQWFRSYFFNPLTRSLRSGRKLPVAAIIFLSQVSTMGLIGLWHGLTWNFAIWGIWHGLGLFINNRWTDWLRSHSPEWTKQAGPNQALRFGSWFLTFHWVVLGWVWFALPDIDLSWQVFRHLFGLAT